MSESSILIEVELGDAEFVVRKHPDGLYTIDMPEPRLVLTADQFEQVVYKFWQTGRELFESAKEDPV